MQLPKNGLPKVITGIICFTVILAGSNHIATFLRAIANPGRSGGRPEDILIGGMLLSIGLIALVGIYKLFSK